MEDNKEKEFIPKTRRCYDIDLLDKLYYKPEISLLQTGSKVVAETGSKLVAKWQQSGSKLVAENNETGSTTGSKVVANISFPSLIGLQKKIILFLYESCKAARSKITNPISLEHLSDSLKASIGTIKSAIRRLENKRLLTRVEYKNGRGGWSKYSIPEDLFKELLQIETGSKVVAKWYQTDSKVVANWEQSGSKVVSELVANPPSSSSINKLTTNTILPVDNLPEDWKAINYEPIRHIGFSETQLLQLYATKHTTAKIVQESIEHFAFGLMHSAKTKLYPAPLNVIMGVLLKGGSWIEPSYHSPTAEPLKPIAEQKKEQDEDRERNEALFDRQYFKWFNELSNDELKQLFPDYDLSSNAHQRFYYFEGTCRSSCVEVFRKTKWIEIFNNIPD
jgi:hypothetical protein